MDEKQREIVIEEWKLLQETIRQQAGFAFKIRGWLIALLTALTVGLFSEKIQLGVHLYLAFSSLVVFVFFSIELSQRVIQRRARERCSLVEAALRNDSDYDGPAITDRMKTAKYSPFAHIRNCLLELKSPPVYFPSAVIVITLAVVVTIALIIQ